MTKDLQIETVPQSTETNKMAKLVLGIIFDLIGMASYIIPGIAEVIDVVWAPISGLLLAKMYKGATGKIAGTISFIEELLPGVDVIPTFTITWFYVYVIKKGN